jgi:hypothetical protein
VAKKDALSAGDRAALKRRSKSRPVASDKSTPISSWRLHSDRCAVRVSLEVARPKADVIARIDQQESYSLQSPGHACVRRARWLWEGPAPRRNVVNPEKQFK